MTIFLLQKFQAKLSNMICFQAVWCQLHSETSTLRVDQSILWLGEQTPIYTVMFDCKNELMMGIS